MLKRFRNKLKTLSDQDFLDKLIHHDIYPRKYYPVIEQEARSRFFSNRHFNGENDNYIHPNTLRPTATRKNIVTGTVMIVAAAVLVFVLLYSLSTNHLPYLHTTSASRAGSTIKPPADPSPANQSIIAVANEDADNENISTQPETVNPDKSDQIVHDQNSASSEPTVASPVENPKRNKYLQWEASYRPIYVTPEKQVVPVETPLEAEETTPAPIEDNQQLAQNTQPEVEPAVPEKLVTETTAPAKQEIASPEKPILEKEIPVAEKPNSEPTVVTNKEPLSDYSNVSQLSVPMLRKFIPFINDWAYQQTQMPGIKDYYVENNSLVNLVLTREYSDSLAAFQHQKAPQMMNSYFSALKAKLGEDFPHVQIEIKFLKYNADL